MMTYHLNDILTEPRLNHVVSKVLKDKHILVKSWNLDDYNIRPATVGLAGFLGDHLKVELKLNFDSKELVVNLFIKSMPLKNGPKAKFIDEFNYYRREMIMFRLFEDIEGMGPAPWRPKVYLCDEQVVVMPDLTLEGFSIRNTLLTLDRPHLSVTVRSIAQFHAAFTNHNTKQNINSKSFYEENKDVLKEPSFFYSPWMKAGAKLVVEFLQQFSTLKNVNKAKLLKAFVKTCHSLREYEGTVNVIVHKDLWNNNIMFKYENGEPVSAVLVDYQCVRYGPPAFDLMSFLYMNTDSKTRLHNERQLLERYFQIYCEHLDEVSKDELLKLGYNLDAFLCLCEKARGYGLLVAAMIFPYVMMEGTAASATFDDPTTFDDLNNRDRTAPVVTHATTNTRYRDRLLDVFEEIVQYLL